MSNKRSKEKKSKRLLKEDNRPSADDLDGHPKLKKQLEKMKGKPHPIDRGNWLKNLTISYLGPYLQIAKSMVVTQSCHYNLPEEDGVIRSTNRVGSRLYGKDISKEKNIDDEIKFEMTPNPDNTLLGSLFGTYWWMVTYITLLSIVVTSLDFVAVYATKEALTDIADQISKHGKIVDKDELIIWFVIIWLCGVITTVLSNWTTIQQYRFVFRLMGSTYSLIYMKMLKIGIINSHEHNEGSIINYIQSDINQFNMFAYSFSALTSGIVNLVLSIALGVVYFKSVFLVLFVGLIVLGVLNGFFMKSAISLRRVKQQKTDKRVNVLKNVLRNLTFIKINGIENLFVKKVNETRKAELIQLIKVKLAWVGISFVFVLGTPTITIIFLIFYFRSGGKLDVASVTILLRIFSLMQNSLFQLPGSLNIWVNVTVSIRRINLFLESKELEYNLVRKKPELGETDAVRIENGSFFWDKKLTKEEASQIRKEKIQALKKANKAEKKAIKLWKRKNKKNYMTDSESSALKQTLLSNFTSDSMKEKMKKMEDQDKFELENLDFSAKKGELTTIIGKTGSGKSTILYSILGETMIKDYSQTRVMVNGNICYCGQTPWLLNGTIKENILLHKDFDQEKFDWALKYSALEEDLPGWDEREEHKIGESGSALSGGQRARVALARCLYQE